MTERGFRAKFSIRFPFGRRSSVEVVYFDISETLNRGYHGEVHLASFGAIEFEEVVGARVRVCISCADVLRVFHCVVVSIEVREQVKGRYQYVLYVVDPLGVMGFGKKFSIHQHKNAVEIVSDVLSLHGLPKVKWCLDFAPFKREYCVQYDEDDTNFIRRVLFEEGINYCYDSDLNAENLIFLAGNGNFPRIGKQASLTFRGAEGEEAWDQFSVSKFDFAKSVCVTSVFHSYFDPEEPSKYLSFQASVSSSAGESRTIEDARYLGRQDFRSYLNPGKEFEAWATNYARRELHSKRLRSEVQKGTCNHPLFSPGFKFELSRHALEELCGEHVIISTRHIGEAAAALEESSDPDGRNSYIVEFCSIPEKNPIVPWEPAHMPCVNGMHLAEVWGPPNHKGAYHDDFGRVILRFPWDTGSDKSQPTSRWVPVLQTNGGQNNGSVRIPEVGDIVFVSYLLSDPEQPYIVGTYRDGRQVVSRRGVILEQFKRHGAPLGERYPVGAENEEYIFDARPNNESDIAGTQAEISQQNDAKNGRSCSDEQESGDFTQNTLALVDFFGGFKK